MAFLDDRRTRLEHTPIIVEGEPFWWINFINKGDDYMYASWCSMGKMANTHRGGGTIIGDRLPLRGGSPYATIDGSVHCFAEGGVSRRAQLVCRVAKRPFGCHTSTDRSGACGM